MNSIRAAVVEKKIRELMTDESRQIEAGIDAIVESIQNTITVSHLPQELLSIMNMWARTEWCHLGVAKFQHCLRTIVAWELRDRVFNCLVKEVRGGGAQMVDDDDLRYVVNRVSSALSSSDGDRRYWLNMDIDLLAEAKHWVSVHGELVTMCDAKDFRWYDIIKQVGWRAEPIKKQVAIRSLKRLPCDFQHEADWTCAICLDVDASVPRCVITECAHIYHELCLKKHYRVFLAQQDNHGKACFSCPMCRAVIN